MPASLTMFLPSHRVSPVLTLSILPMAPMSPQQISLVSSPFLPFMKYRRPSFSVLPVVTLYKAMSLVTLPRTTLIMEYLPYWSEMVLNTMAAVGPLGSMATSMALPSSSWAASAGISVATGTRSRMVCISISTPRPVMALPHRTGQMLPSRTPIFRPLAISSADSSMVSKNFSISSSSAPAAFSISSARRDSTSSATSAGMGHSTTLPPLTS